LWGLVYCFRLAVKGGNRKSVELPSTKAFYKIN
jgi:hypothetical protein